MIVFSHSICHFVDIVVFMILLQLFYVLRTRNGSVMEEEIHLEGKFILQYEPCMHNCIMTRILEPYASLCIFLNKNLLVRNFPRGGRNTQHICIQRVQSKKCQSNPEISVQLHCNPEISAHFI